MALPLSQLLNDSSSAELVNEQPANENLGADEEDEIWLGEPSAHLNHVVAYHQVVREQMQSIVVSLEKQHKQVTQLTKNVNSLTTNVTSMWKPVNEFVITGFYMMETLVLMIQ